MEMRARTRASVRQQSRSIAIRSRRRVANKVAPESKLSVESILVPTDFSDKSGKALKYAMQLVKLFGAQITLLHVVEPIQPDFDVFPMALNQQQTVKAAEVELKRFASRLVGKPAGMRYLVRLGKPYYQVAEAAQASNADLIIIATHGRTGLKHILLGSTAERVVRHAPCPVLTVRQKESDSIKTAARRSLDREPIED
jgi:universal stress protein A